MEHSEYYKRQLRAEEREEKIIKNLRNEVNSGNKSAKSILHRILVIDSLLMQLQREHKNSFHNPSMAKWNKEMNRQLKLALMTEKRGLLNVAERKGFPGQYLKKIRQKKTP